VTGLAEVLPNRRLLTLGIFIKEEIGATCKSDYALVLTKMGWPTLIFHNISTQGDQVGRFFATLVIVYFGQFF
jgi:hypothetical protein